MFRRLLLLLFSSGLLLAGSGPLNLGNDVNSDKNEAMPSVSGNGKVLIYQTDYIVDSGGLEDMHLEENWDLWIVNLDENGYYSDRRILNAVNSDYFDGQASLSVDGQVLYFTSNRPRQKGSKKRNMDIWFSTADEGTWARPKRLGAPINTKADETFPSLSWNNRELFFSRPDGIYVSAYAKNKWQKPRKLPRTINSGHGETACAIHADDTTLYFSSKRPGGYGGYDIYMSQRKIKKKRRRARIVWSKPVNLGRQINSPGDDLFVSIPAVNPSVFFSSTRPGGEGGEDLYQAGLPQNARPNLVTLLYGFSLDKYSKKPLQSEVEITDLNSGKTLHKIKTGRDGRFVVVLNTTRWYGIIISAKNHFFLSENIDLRNVEPYKIMRKEYDLLPFGVTGNLKLGNIFFARGKYRILKESRSDLKRLGRLLKDNPKIKIEIQGHTDNRGSKSYNKKLSQKRAEAVLKGLLKTGAKRAQLRAVGYGDEKPIASNDTDEGRAKNRRTAFKILN